MPILLKINELVSLFKNALLETIGKLNYTIEANGVDANLLINQSISYDVVETTPGENIPSYMHKVSSSSRKKPFLLMGGIYDEMDSNDMLSNSTTQNADDIYYVIDSVNESVSSNDNGSFLNSLKATICILRFQVKLYLQVR